jgi:hypothetical protein
MGKVTVLKGENQTLSTGSVLAAVQTAAAGSAGAHVKIKRLEISQSGSTTLAMIRGEIATRDTAGTLTVTSLAPPAGGTARSGITSSADSGGTYTSLYPLNFPNTAGYLHKPAPDEEIWIPPSTLFVVRFLAAPGTLTGWTVVLVLDED